MEKWRRTFSEVGRVLGLTSVGFFAGVLALFYILHSLGVLNIQTRPLILLPVIDGRNEVVFPPTATPTVTVTPTPAPTATATVKQMHIERWKWENRKNVDPFGGLNSDEITIETSKKKKKKDRGIPEHDGFDKWGNWTDLNRDGVVERRVMMYPVGSTVEGQVPIFATSMIHGCCDCALTHRLSIQTAHDEFGFAALILRWTRLEPETKEARVRKWGPGWNRPSNPFGAENAMPDFISSHAPDER